MPILAKPKVSPAARQQLQHGLAVGPGRAEVHADLDVEAELGLQVGLDGRRPGRAPGRAGGPGRSRSRGRWPTSATAPGCRGGLPGARLSVPPQGGRCRRRSAGTSSRGRCSPGSTTNSLAALGPVGTRATGAAGGAGRAGCPGAAGSTEAAGRAVPGATGGPRPAGGAGSAAVTGAPRPVRYPVTGPALATAGGTPRSGRRPGRGRPGPPRPAAPPSGAAPRSPGRGHGSLGGAGRKYGCLSRPAKADRAAGRSPSQNW